MILSLTVRHQRYPFKSQTAEAAIVPCSKGKDIHNDGAHNADDDHGGENKAEGEALRFHEVLLDRLPSVLILPPILQRGVGCYLVNFSGFFKEKSYPELRFIRAFRYPLALRSASRSDIFISEQFVLKSLGLTTRLFSRIEWIALQTPSVIQLF